MKDGDGFVQAHNAQAVVDTESLPIVGQRVSGEPNDKKELKADLQSMAIAQADGLKRLFNIQAAYAIGQLARASNG
jgi:hypothetical protein